MNELHQTLAQITPNDTILDVRTREEYLEGHVPGSSNIPYDEIENDLTRINKAGSVYVYCRVGRRAQVASSLLEKHGFKNVVCIGDTGMPDWISAGFDTQK